MRSLTALALLFSINAWACPNLAGNYTCTYQDGSSEMVSISQENKNGVITYSYNGSSVPADNIARQIPDDETIKQGTFRAWCEDVVLKAEMLGKYYSNGSLYGDLTLNMSFSKIGNDLKNVTVGLLKNSGGEYPLNSEVTCSFNSAN